MRWVLTVAALAAGVWYLRSRRNRDQLGQVVQDSVPQDVQARVRDAAATATSAAQGVAGAATQRAQGLAQGVSQAAGDAASGVGQAASSATDRARQATETATQATAGAATGTAEGDASSGDTPRTGATAPAASGPQDAQQAATSPTMMPTTGAGDTDELAPVTASTGGAVATDVNTPPPSIRETMQAEMADVSEKVDTLRAQSEEPPDPAEKSAGEFFGAGTMATTDLHLAQAPSTPREAETVGGGVEPLGAGSSTATGDVAATAGATSATGAAAGTAGAASPTGTPPAGSALRTATADLGNMTSATQVSASPAASTTPTPTTSETPPAPTTAPVAGVAPEGTPSGVPSGGQGAGGTSTVGRTLTTDDSIVPEGERPRPIAGEDTTTTAAGLVDILSPVPDGPTATGEAEPLPAGLAAGAPGTGGPAASSIAPSTPGAGAPRTGMETVPVVDRAAEVAERTGGKYVGNRKKRVFHLATSSDLPNENNRVYFETIEEARAAGFTPAPGEDFAE